MEIKGTSVRTTVDFVRHRFPERFKEWFSALPESSRIILRESIYATSWYPLTESVVIPTQIVGEMFYNDKITGSVEVGKFSAEAALNGVYKIFVRISSPEFVLNRSTNVFATYYKPGEISVIENSGKRAILQFKQFEQKDSLIMHRIAGWVQGTLGIIQKRVVQTEVDIQPDAGSFIVGKVIAMWD